MSELDMNVEFSEFKEKLLKDFEDGNIVMKASDSFWGKGGQFFFLYVEFEEQKQLNSLICFSRDSVVNQILDFPEKGKDDNEDDSNIWKWLKGSEERILELLENNKNFQRDALMNVLELNSKNLSNVVH